MLIVDGIFKFVLKINFLFTKTSKKFIEIHNFKNISEKLGFLSKFNA